MKIAISGAGGLIGKKLTAFFRLQGHTVISLERIIAQTPVEKILQELESVDVIINLAGAPIIKRWNAGYKQTLMKSRVVTTQKLVSAVKLMNRKPALFISASAVGIYASGGKHSEKNHVYSDNYLGKICKEWENAANLIIPDSRLAIVRLGIVLSRDGGALARLLPLFNVGLGGRIGDGLQGFPWIHIDDLAGAIQYIINNENLDGVFNFTSPAMDDNRSFTRNLSKSVGMPAVFTVPVWALKLLYGEGSVSLVEGSFVIPAHLLAAGFTFRFENLPDALRDLTS